MNFMWKCSILASVSQKFPGGGGGVMPQTPPAPACFVYWEVCETHLHPRDYYLQLAPPPPPPPLYKS